MLLSLLAIALTMGGHVLTDAGTPLMAAMGGFSLLFSTLSVHITNQLKRTIDKFNTDNYSNVEDFPYRFRPTGALPAALLDCTDVGCICLRQPLVQTRRRPHHVGSDDLHAVHNPAPTTAVYKQQEPDPANDGSKDTATTDSPSEIDAIGNEVLSIILRRYREPHLQKSEVLSEIPKGKVNAASKYITQLGYYNLVNMFRLQHAALYKEAHPAAKQEEIAEESGFSSRTAYYKARKSVAAIDDKIVKCVKL